jgi:hypothetical protein
MPSCPHCGTPVTLRRWLKTAGEGGTLNTRCNGCKRVIRAFTPWYINLLLFGLPFGLLVWSANYFEIPAWVIVAALIWCALVIPVGYACFGKVKLDE